MSEVLKKVSSVEKKNIDNPNVLKGNFSKIKTNKTRFLTTEPNGHTRRIIIFATLSLCFFSILIYRYTNRNTDEKKNNPIVITKELINVELFNQLANENYKEIPPALGKLVTKWEFDHPSLTNNYSIILKRNGLKYEALNILNKAIKHWPNHEYLYNNRGTIYFLENKYYEAIADFKKAIEIDKNYKEAILNIAICYEKIKKWSLSYHYYKSYLLNFSINETQRNIIMNKLNKMLPMVIYEQKKELKNDFTF